MLRINIPAVLAAALAMVIVPRVVHGCTLAMSTYIDYYYTTDEDIEVYGNGEDYSDCAEWGHAYELEVYTTGSVTGPYEDGTVYDLSETVHFHITTIEDLIYGSAFKIFCAGYQAWVGPATAQGRLPVRPPEFQPCGQPSNANLISGPSTGGSPGWLQMR